ncbi:MAG TPA: MerR family DNA-binding protein [Thermoanaerobaculia bacterium]|nr:MerR family DNA-binding protein [Thermoanaerobaculia bacterium]
MNAELLRVGDVASKAGVSVDTVRHYERKGVLQNVFRDGSGYRRYPEDAVRRVRVIRRAISLGFSLDELSAIFRERASGKPPCGRVRELAGRKLVELDERIAALIALRAALTETLSGWDDRLRATTQGGFAHLLETLIPMNGAHE